MRHIRPAFVLVFVALALTACPIQREDTSSTGKIDPSEVTGDDATPVVSPLPTPTQNGRPPLGRLSLAQIRRAAVADGEIDRAEAIALVRGRDQGVERVRATLKDGTWEVEFDHEDGCHYFSVIDAVTGKGIEGRASCP